MKQNWCRALLGLSLATLPAMATTYDYDGDGIADVAVRRASTYYWYVKNTGDDNFNSERQDGIQRTQFGKQETDIPIAADFDGDGITDFAVRRESNFTWYVLNSSGDNTNSERGDGIQREVFGKQAGDIPLAADFDGDGIDDFVIRRESNYTWYIKNSSGSNFNSEREDGIQRIEFGKQVGDIPVVGYFDEDNIADVAVYRSSNTTWYVKNSSGSNYNSEREDGIQRIEIGQDGDIPVPADYDGDGITDVAVRRPSTFEWIIIESGSGETVTQTFGRNEEDIPVPADYDGDGKADIAVRRSSNQTFYVLNSSGSNFNSDREDGIQRINFGRQEDDIPVNAPITEIIAKLNSVNAVDDSNSAPVADAGSDQTVEQGATVTLDGSNSTDADNDTLSYSWSFTSKPENSSATLSNSTAESPTFIADEVGEYIVALTVNDGTEDSETDSVTILAEAVFTNSAPSAEAGDDQTVDVGDTVTLDGSRSSDPDGDTLNYTWRISSKPEESTISLTNRMTVSPTFIPDVSGDYVIELTVSDGDLDSDSDSMTVTANDIEVPNTIPVADAGSDQTVTEGATVNLDGSGSTDPDDDPLTYTWDLSSQPDGSNISLSNRLTVSPSFTPVVVGTYEISLVVNDGSADSDPDSVSVTVESIPNNIPVANAGSDQSVTVGDLVTFDGSGSSDADGDEITYLWRITSKPANSAANLSNRDTIAPTLEPDAAGEYIVSLTVNDGVADSATDTVSITATEATTEITENEARIASTFSANRFEAAADDSIAARPYVYVDFIDLNRDGNNEAAILQSNGVPSTYDYDYTTSDVDNRPNTCFDDPNNGPDEADSGGCYAIEASARAFVIPTQPEVANSITNISSDQHSGMAISGATFELPTAPSPEDNAGYAITNVYDTGWEVLDDCNGHSGYLGAPYHYHGDPTYPINDGTNEHTQRATEASDCLPGYELVVDEETGHAPAIGFMADGFPIYGTDGYDIGDALDECNGHLGATKEYPNGIYHYHALNYDAVTANGTGSRREEPPLPECLSGKVWLVPEYHSPELADSDKRDIDSEINVDSTDTIVDARTLAEVFAANRFSATSTAEARPYVYVELIDWDFDGNNDTAMLVSNGVASTYDYDDTTSNSDNVANICFDDPTSGPDAGCYPVDANNRVFLFSLNPSLADSTTAINENDHSGMAISAATFVHPEEDSPAGKGYAVTNSYDEGWEVLDDCNGNVSVQGGPYHYHGDPTNPVRDSTDEHTVSVARAEGCLPDFSSEIDETTSHGSVIGFMADGFPIYGQEGYNSGDTLDNCNGHTGVTAEFPNGIYHYHAISADTANSENLAPLPECLSGEVRYLPNYPSPELSEQ